MSSRNAVSSALPSSFTHCSPISTRPESGCRSPTSWRTRVVLPPPDSPIRTVSSPAGSSARSRRSTGSPPSAIDTSSNLRGSAAGGVPPVPSAIGPLPTSAFLLPKGPRWRRTVATHDGRTTGPDGRWGTLERPFAARHGKPRRRRRPRLALLAVTSSNGVSPGPPMFDRRFNHVLLHDRRRH